MEKFVDTNGIRLHYLEYNPDADETLIMMHGLTANAHSFAGLINAGLAENLHVISVDLRGRGLSDKPETGYSMADHAKDIVGLMDTLGIDHAVVGGHSFGGLLTIFMGAKYPARIAKMVLLDAGIVHPEVRELIASSFQRLGKVLPSWDNYLQTIKNSPYYYDGFWSDDLEAYYREDVEIRDDGTVISRSTPEAIAQCADAVLGEDWPALMAQANQPAILIHATAGVGPPGTPPVITEEGAQWTVQGLGNCHYVQVPGHHVTMVFGKYAEHPTKAIKDFLHA